MPGYFQVAGGAIIEKGEKVLLTRRAQGRWNGGHWEFVSGRIEQGEDLETGLKREVMEEVGLEIETKFPIYVAHFFRGEERDKNEVFLATYVCRFVSGEVRLKTDEQDKFEWVEFGKLRFSDFPGLQEDWREEIGAYKRLGRF